MSVFNTLLHGSPEDVLAVLESEPLTVIDLKAAAANAFKRLAYLEAEMRKVEVIRKAGEPDRHDPADYRGADYGDDEDREACAERAAFIAGYCACYARHTDPDWEEYPDALRSEAAGELYLWRAKE